MHHGYLKKSCDSIMEAVRTSCLNYACQETPYFMYLTVRKSKIKSEKRINVKAVVKNCETHYMGEGLLFLAVFLVVFNKIPNKCLTRLEQVHNKKLTSP